MYTKDDLDKILHEIDQTNERQEYIEHGPYPARVTSCNDANSLQSQRANKALDDALLDMRRERQQSFSQPSRDLSPKL